MPSLSLPFSLISFPSSSKLPFSININIWLQRRRRRMTLSTLLQKKNRRLSSNNLVMESRQRLQNFSIFFFPQKNSKRANTGDSMFLTTWKHAKKGKVNGNAVHLFISTFTKWMKNNCWDWDRLLLLLWFFWFWNWNYLGAKNESSADELKSNQKPNQWRHERTWRGNNLKIPCIQLLKREYYPVITALSPAIESPTPKWKVSDSKLQFSR